MPVAWIVRSPPPCPARVPPQPAGVVAHLRLVEQLLGEKQGAARVADQHRVGGDRGGGAEPGRHGGGHRRQTVRAARAQTAKLSAAMAGEQRITLSEAARRSGVSAATLKRWAADKVIPVRRGRWTAAAAAQARVVARMRERGHSLEELRKAGREGRLSFGLAEDLFPSPAGEQVTVEEVARETGLEPELVERILVILGTPLERERTLDPATSKLCGTARGCWPPASRSSPSCSSSGSTCSR